MVVFVCQQEIYSLILPESITQTTGRHLPLPTEKSGLFTFLFRKRTRTMNTTVASKTIPGTGRGDFP